MGALTSACNPDDTGNCCTVIAGGDAEKIPKAEKSPSGEFIDAIKQDPAFDCSNLTCVSYKGSKAFCTKQCKEAADCPEGFACTNVLQSDPGPGATIRPEDTFCVKVGHVCEE